MYYDPGLASMIQRLTQTLNRQETELLLLKQKIEDLTEQVRSLREEKRFVVEKIDYHFEQLKVERLEGTLNIGLTPDSGQALEQFMVNGETLSKEVSETGARDRMLADIRRDVQAYMEEGALSDLQRLEQEHHCMLGPELRSFVLKDVEKQLVPRIQHYVKQCGNPDEEDSIGRCREQTVDNVKRDVREAFAVYLRKTAKGKEEPG